MKARKRLSHTLLISETMTQLKFPAQNSDIKKRVESLIEREYLERDSNEAAVYRYLAERLVRERERERREEEGPTIQNLFGLFRSVLSVRDGASRGRKFFG
jgi:hypothetical protein